MKAFYVMAALAAFNLAAAQKTIQLKEFKGLAVGADTKVTLVKSTENKLVVNGGDDEELGVENEGGFLTLNGADFDITLYYKNSLESISAASDAQVYSKEEINIKDFSITAASDAKVELTLNVKKLHTTAASDAQVILTGKATDHDATLSSDADLKAEDLLTENANIVLSSDASAVITAKGIVNATVGSDGSLKIYGKPKKVNEVKGSDAQIVVVK
jgi:hypothetical protein